LFAWVILHLDATAFWAALALGSPEGRTISSRPRVVPPAH